MALVERPTYLSFVQFDADGLARDICNRVSTWSWRDDPIALAAGLGVDVLEFGASMVHGDGELLLRAGGERVIHVREDLSDSQLSWTVLHEIAHLWMGDYCVANHPEEERRANLIAAALQMPIGCFLGDILVSSDFAWLAARYRASQTAAALRVAEITGRSTAVLTPTRVRKAGAPHPWPPDTQLRALAACGAVPSITLTDEPGRLAVVAA